jgi:hypothetical protein
MEPISQDEAREMRELLEKFDGPMVRTWNVNALVYELLGQLQAPCLSASDVNASA